MKTIMNTGQRRKQIRAALRRTVVDRWNAGISKEDFTKIYKQHQKKFYNFIACFEPNGHEEDEVAPGEDKTAP